MRGSTARSAMLAVLLASACARQTEPEPPPLTGGCRSCHGSAKTSAPPKALDGTSDHPAVGAHEAHLFGTRMMRPVSCGECHLQYEDVGDPGHLDDSPGAELIFGSIATSSGARPLWNRDTLTCSGVYCHGGASPKWNVTDGSQVACGSCHGLPPPAPHPAQNNCVLCHAPVAGSAQTIADPSRHIDGILDVLDTAACSGCHGSVASIAPPSDLAGESATDRITVGAHRSHLTGGSFSRSVECSTCHVVPANVEDPGHIDPSPAEVASSAGWNRELATCSGSSCHGTATPSWTIVDGTQAKCGSCHALPPPAPHPANDRCEQCHLPTAGPNQTIAHRATHVDGVVQAALEGCTGCHGTEENLAPPNDTTGGASSTLRGVGAHQTHMCGGRSSVPVACNACHKVPSRVDEPGHNDTPLPAEVIGNGWSENDATCSSSYCHGSTLTGGTNTSPSWTNAGGSEAACGSCHGLPPPAPHPANDACQLCHLPTAGPNQTIADATKHVDGVLQVADGTCVDCHGGGDISAPPKDLEGMTDVLAPTVGAHRSHVTGAALISRAIACSECHVVPSTRDDPGHVDTDPPAELTWGPLASHGGLSPSYDPIANTCSNTYCHGATLTDGSIIEPSWTVVDGSQSACGTCHGDPPGGTHPSDDRCELCHLPTAGPNKTIAGLGTHLDGTLQVSTSCDSCHGESGVSAPPRDLDGMFSPSLITVGAHRVHLAGGASGKPVECSECHLVPAAADSPGHRDTMRPAEVAFGAIAAFGATPAYVSPRCADTYCHSGPGAANAMPAWNAPAGTEAECGGCHGLPPPTPAHQNITGDCSTCHLPTAGPNQTIANRATHVDGILQVTSLDCATCHGDMTSSAPPRDLAGDTAPTDREVGSHRVHLSGGASSAPVPCSSCHLVPVDANDPGHMDTPAPAELTFSGRAAANFVTPSYDPASSTCTNTYCHGEATPVWNVAGGAPCGSCHGRPPPAPHPQVEDCALCHDMNPTRHLDGSVDVHAPGPCETCHGTSASAAPPPDLAGLMVSPRAGAHRVHLAGTSNSRAVACTECHVAVNPATIDQAGHYDSAEPAELIFGVLARTGARTPDYRNGTCSDTYCHGTGAPDWTDGALACNACHGMPPNDATHGNGTATQCESCHPDTAGPGQTIVNPAKHIDGVVDTSATCDACHGQNGDPMPPRDLAGLTVSDRVGVHAAHRNPLHSAAVECSTCHLVPASYGATGHADTPPPAEVIFAGRARLDGASPAYSGATFRCSNTYCHQTAAVTWNDTDGSEHACTACHAMPPATPAHMGQGPNGCNSCHSDDAGPNQAITVPALHVDGVVQVTGGGCDTCHGSPPSPGNESYAGSAGAHAAHATTLGYECAICHGNNGAGPQHNQGNGTVVRGNVNLTFGTTSFAGGTTMGAATYTRGTMTCAVGCHNPIVGNPAETQNVANTITWGAPSPSCRGCHDQVQAGLPRSHDISALGDSGCLECHDQTGHTLGTAVMRDPDPADAFAYSAANPSNLCKTCHDGGAGTHFGGQTARNVSPFWNVSSHGAAGYTCMTCHTYHSSTASGPLFVDAASATCMASGCHAGLSADFNRVAGGPISHHRIEGGAGIQLGCVSCHNPHLAQAVPLTTIDPDNKWATYSIPATARTAKRSSGDYRAFCLRCHDATPPPGVQGAMNIAGALAGGTEPSNFKKGSDSLHKEGHSGYNCQNCHMSHGSSGTAGINRGRLLMNYMTVNNTTYTGKGSCSTSPTGTSFRCH